VEVYKGKILVVDEEVDIRNSLKKRLTTLGYIVFVASNGKDALTTFNNENLDLVILDIMLPNFDGYDVCREIRNESKIPIMILTSSTKISDRIIGLDLGADDCLVKPFSLKELEARIRSLLRRYSPQINELSIKNQKKIKIGPLLIDLNRGIVSRNNFIMRLTDIEYRLLELLVENPGKKLSRLIILDNVWGYTPERYIDTRIVDVNISRLRAKIEKDPSKPDLIITIRGIGYMFQKY
jgi:OmpR family response regulator RpaB